MPSLGSRITPSLLAPDLRRSIRFYEEILGFRLSGCEPNAEAPEWAELSRDGIVLWLYAIAPGDTPREPVMTGTFFLFPDDVMALARELEGKIQFEWGPERMPYGLLEFAIRDPNGYLLAFAQEV